MATAFVSIMLQFDGTKVFTAILNSHTEMEGGFTQRSCYDTKATVDVASSLML